MSIEKRIDRQELNIKELNLEQPQAGVEFDPKRDVSERDWELLSQTISDNPAFYGMLAVLRQVRPDKFTHIPVPEGDIFKRRIQGLIDENLWYSVVTEYAGFKQLFPDKFEPLTFRTAPKLWRKGNEQLASGDVGPGFLIDMRVLFPDRAGELSLDKIPTDPWLETLAKGEPINEPLQQVMADDFSLKLAYFAAFKALLPDDAKKLKVDCQTWEIWRSHLKFLLAQGKTKSVDQAGMIRDLAMIAAQEIKITEQGLELVMPKKQSETATPPTPEIKNF